MVLRGLSVSGFCNKLPQTQWLKTTQIYSFTALEVRSLKSGFYQGCVPSRGFEESLFPCLFLLLEAACIPWSLPPLSRHITPPFDSISTSPSFSLALIRLPPSYKAPCDYFELTRILAWKVLWTEEPSRLQSMGSLRVGHDWATSLSLFPFLHWRRQWQPTPVFLPGESQGWGSLVSCRLWGRAVWHDWNNLAAAAAG